MSGSDRPGPAHHRPSGEVYQHRKPVARVKRRAVEPPGSQTAMLGTNVVVLVVADESVSGSCVEVLSDRYEVHTAGDLAAATAVVESTAVDVALVGADLPDATPRAVVDRLRDHGTVPRVALLADEPVDPADEATYDAVASLPPTEAELGAVVSRLTACKRYDDHIDRFYALSVACADLAERLDASELSTSDAYARLRAERDEARVAADDALAAVDRDDRPSLVPHDADGAESRRATHRNTQCEIHD